MTKLKTAYDIIAALGGNAPVAHMTGRKYNAVSNWGAGNFLPSDTFELMNAELKAIGCVADRKPNIWNMCQPVK